MGWLAYFVSNHTLAGTSGIANAYTVPVAQGEFILAVALFVAGAFIYANARDFLAPLLGIALALIVFAGLRTIYWPGSVTLSAACRIGDRNSDCRMYLLSTGSAGMPSSR